MKTQFLLNKVRDDYNLIAESFSKTRQKLSWPEIEYLKKYINHGYTVLDIGCGNGRLYNFIKDYNLNYFGGDNSEKLLEQARSLFPEMTDKFVYADMLKLPFSDQQFDIVICLAAFHHLPSASHRIAALNELKRVLKPNGLLLMTNWYAWQGKFFKNLLTDWRLKNEWNDFFIPWKDGNKLNRYYHGFTIGELNNLFTKTSFNIVENHVFISDSGVKRNILSVVRK